MSLKGRRFETVDALTAALTGAVCWWNEDKPPYQWEKMPQQQPIYSLGGYGSVMEYTLNTWRVDHLDALIFEGYV